MRFSPPFPVGTVISNAKLAETFKVGNMGGMRRSKTTNTLVLICDNTKGLYHDQWHNGQLLYTGMGKIGDQVLVGNQNKTLAESKTNGVSVHLFEVNIPGEYTYSGQVCLAAEPYQDIQPDDNGDNRKVWIFPLKKKEEERSMVSDDMLMDYEYLESEEEKTVGSTFQQERDISLFDPSLFEDPIKLLEYLQNEDSEKKSSPVIQDHCKFSEQMYSTNKTRKSASSIKNNTSNRKSTSDYSCSNQTIRNSVHSSVQRERTIKDAVAKVLSVSEKPLTVPEICSEIINRGLYKFNTQYPYTVINHAIRRSCAGVTRKDRIEEKIFGIIEDAESFSKYYLLEKAKSGLREEVKREQSVDNIVRSPILYGYDLIDGVIRINEEEAEAVDAIISLHEDGYSYSQIEYLLGESKYRTVTGKKFYPAAIQAIVKNKKIYEGETGYPPIVKKHNLGAGESIRSINPITCIEQYKNPSSSQVEMAKERTFQSMDVFLIYIKNKGIPVKDNRWNGGCVWVRADAEIADLMAHITIEGHGFKYSPKCKSFKGAPGWYY